MVTYVDVTSGEWSTQILPLKRKKPGHIRYVAISDTHILHDDITLPPGDVLIHCGDILVEDRGQKEDMKWKMLLQDFNEWLGVQRKKNSFQQGIFVTGGNHDRVLEELEPSNVQAILTNAVFVKAQEKRIDCGGGNDHRVYLCAASRGYGGSKGDSSNTAFQYATDQEAEKIYTAIPASVDVLVTHGPPQGILDGPGNNAGCPILFQHVMKRIRPKVHVFGHWHANTGVKKVGETVFVNASTVDFDYSVGHCPVVFDITIEQ